MKRIVLIITFILVFLNPAHSADQNIDMLNKSGREINVYSKKIVNVEVGDAPPSVNVIPVPSVN